MIRIKERKITIHSKWKNLITKREVVDKDGNPLRPIKKERIESHKRFVCWVCKGFGSPPNPFVRAGRIEEQPCTTCKGTGRVILKGNSRIDATFDPDKISLIRRYEINGDHTEVIEIPYDVLASSKLPDL
ncbi:MAG: hypothetical protein R6U44_04155 [Archaeoglobaceae archaeon]